MKKKQTYKICAIMFSVGIALIFALMQLSTHSVILQLQNCLSNVNFANSKEIDEQLFSRYSLRHLFPISDDHDTSKWKIFTRVNGVSLHNFTKGYVWAWYDVSIDNAEDLFPSGLSQGTALLQPVVLTIHKRDGNWTVTNIFDPPYSAIKENTRSWKSKFKEVLQ